MRKFGIIAALAVGTLLSACTTTGTGGGSAEFQKLIEDVQKYTTVACQFLPTAASVADVIGALAGAPGIGTTAAIVGNAICQGFVTKTAAPGGVVVRNVNTPKGIIKVRGTRVAK